MKIGALRHAISIIKVEEVQDAMGSFSLSEITLCNSMADIKPISGNEKFIGNGLFAEATSQIRCRYMSGITTKHKILFGDRSFNILNIQNKDERNIELLMIVKEIF